MQISSIRESRNSENNAMQLPAPNSDSALSGRAAHVHEYFHGSANKLALLLGSLALIAIPYLISKNTTSQDPQIEPNQCPILDNLPAIPSHPSNAMSKNIKMCRDIHPSILLYNTSLTGLNASSGAPVANALSDNCQLADVLGLTHTELADRLEAVVKLAKKSEDGHDLSAINDPSKPHYCASLSSIDYDPKQIENNHIGRCSGIQQLHTCVDLSECTRRVQDLFNRDTETCNRRFVRNEKNNVSLVIKDHTIEDIRNYGHYDGFDPVDLYALLTGDSPEEIRQIAASRILAGKEIP